MSSRTTIFLLLALLSVQCSVSKKSGNPLFEGWYADPEGAVFNKQYWIFPTYSAKYEKQVYFDAFSSEDLVTWNKHHAILDTSIIKWAHKAMWAPCVVKKENQYFFFFSANDIQKQESGGEGGIGIAVASKPEGPYQDYLKKPLINTFFNGGQPIDQFVYRDADNKYYIIYGGWGHCNIARLKDDFTGLLPLTDGTLVKEITPQGYVEGPLVFFRKGWYYLMWSEGGWTNDSYKVAYGRSKTLLGPYVKETTILSSDKSVATGAGHHSVINVPNTDDWYIIYHRRPIPNLDRDHRVTCMERMYFNSDGTIQPIKMTFEGVKKRKL